MSIKKKLIIFTILASLPFLCLPLILIQPKGNNSLAEGSYYSVRNKPVFYGATEITIDKNVTDKFDIKDSRFRIFAKDFEDGDLTHKIKCTYINVNPTREGNYKVKYLVYDSHYNLTEITVPVHVLGKEEKECKIVRTLYTLPSMWNLDMIGVGRCHAGDRQILGIYLPANSSAQIKVLDADKNISVNCLNNYSTRESGVTINCNSSAYQTIKNVNAGVSYDSVPLLTSAVQAQGVALDKTYQIELLFRDDVKPLDYFYYKDDEAKFKTNWRASTNSFGIIDGEALMVVTPFADIDSLPDKNKTNTGSLLPSLDAYLEYYLNVVNRMDEMIGLSLMPTKITDQNVRVKYLAKANANTGAGAYYNGNHIAVGSASASALFHYGWGTLHEIGHGYQGSLGRGTAGGTNICLNETGNNILAHYVQIDKSLYKVAGDWMGGSLANIENSRNQKRLAGNDIFNNNDGTYTNVQEKLYCIVNLLDSFEGSESYSKLFSFYRSLVYANNKNTNIYTIPDVYALFFADEYNANIISYLKSWTMSITPAVEKDIMSRKLASYSILADSVNADSLDEIKQGKNISTKYSLIVDSTLKKYDIKGDLNVTLNIDNLNLIKNKNVALTKNGEIVRIVKINSNTITFSNLPADRYMLRMPTNFDYNTPLCTLDIRQGANAISYDYTRLDTAIEHYTRIGIRGIYNTFGFTLSLSNQNTLATISLGGANLGNQTTEWKSDAKKDTVFVSVTIYNADKSMVIDKLEVKGSQYFSQLTLTNPTLNLQYGYKICIYSVRPQNVNVYSTYTGAQITDYNTTDSNIEYEITAEGLKLVNKADFDTKEVVYNALKTTLQTRIKNYIDSATAEELENREMNTAVKLQIISAYNNLRASDRAEYDEFIATLKRGGKPQITAKSTKINLYGKHSLDLYSLISITDYEDFVIESNANNVEIDTNLNLKKSGSYYVNYIVTDSDGNQATFRMQIVVHPSRVYLYVGIGVGVTLLAGVVAYIIIKHKKHNNRVQNSI